MTAIKAVAKYRKRYPWFFHAESQYAHADMQYEVRGGVLCVKMNRDNHMHAYFKPDSINPKILTSRSKINKCEPTDIVSDVSTCRYGKAFTNRQREQRQDFMAEVRRDVKQGMRIVTNVTYTIVTRRGYD